MPPKLRWMSGGHRRFIRGAPATMLRLILTSVVLLSGALPAFSAERALPEPKGPGIVVPLWPKGTMPGQAIKGTERSLPARGDEVVRLTDISEPSFTVYAADSAKPTPTVIISPGGGRATGVWLTTRKAPKSRPGSIASASRASCSSIGCRTTATELSKIYNGRSGSSVIGSAFESTHSDRDAR